MIYNIPVDKQIKFMNNKAVQRFGKNMKKIREAKGMSQGDIYRATKIERAYISNLEAGKQNPTLETMEKIAKALGVSVSDLTK
jgi:transcriptional regulator with XRE-family HTH domain